MAGTEKRIVELSTQDRHILQSLTKAVEKLQKSPARVLTDAERARRVSEFKEFFGIPEGIDLPDVFPGYHPEPGNRVFPYASGDVLVLGPELFIDNGGVVLSYKGQEYLKTCGEFVRDLPEGGQAFCVKWEGHPRSNEHEDKTGHISTGFAG